jgi:hypothetical protein
MEKNSRGFLSELFNQDRSTRPETKFSRDISSIIVFDTHKFVKIDNEHAVVGADLTTGEYITVIMKPKTIGGENPLAEASRVLNPGEKIIFTGAYEVNGKSQTWQAEEHLVIPDSVNTDDHKIIINKPMFLGKIEENKGKKYQLINIINPETSVVTGSPEEFFSTMLSFYNNRKSSDDSVIIRGFSPKEDMACSTQIRINSKVWFEDAMAEFVKSQISVVFTNKNDEENRVKTLTGEDILKKMESADSGLIWEVIQTSGERKILSHSDDAKTANFVKHANSLTPMFQYKEAANQPAFRNCFAYFKNSKDMVLFFHDNEQNPCPISLINTPHNPDIEKRLTRAGDERTGDRNRFLKIIRSIEIPKVTNDEFNQSEEIMKDFNESKTLTTSFDLRELSNLISSAEPVEPEVAVEKKAPVEQEVAPVVEQKNPFGDVPENIAAVKQKAPVVEQKAPVVEPEVAVVEQKAPVVEPEVAVEQKAPVEPISIIPQNSTDVGFREAVKNNTDEEKLKKVADGVWAALGAS